LGNSVGRGGAQAAEATAAATIEMSATRKLTGTIIIVGNYGSGKTEVAVNLAVQQRRAGRTVRLADLDLVNPYFRTREARQSLEALGIQMVLPPSELLQADLPILVPGIAGLIRQPGDLDILDVGGDPVGAKVLSAMADAFADSDKKTTMLQVINPHRPNTDTIAGCLAMRAAIEKASRMEVGGWIGNAHMMEETTVAHVREGYEFMRALQAQSGVPMRLITVPHRLIEALQDPDLYGMLLPIRRQLVPPWLKPQPLD
jgi:hypothetical protein